MELTSLRVAVEVARQGSFSAAAKSLHYVQSNITAHIKKLESELGVVLFERQPRGMLPTAAGQTLVTYAQQLLKLEAEARDAVRDIGGPGGRLRIGSMETTMAVRLPPLLKTLHQQYPEAEISIHTGRSDALVEKVLAFELDCAFVSGRIAHPDLLVCDSFTEELVLLAPREADERAASTLLVFREGCHYRRLAEQWIRETGPMPFRIMEYGALEGIIGCVDAGLGCTLLPRSVISQRPLVGDYTVSALPPHIARADTRLIWRREAPVGRLLNCLRELTTAGQAVGAVA
ncbi:LysR substrate-binding domain-containing protein [Granulosicoccaceae sp. 1_MG-2023]|nr:LysR substrate-binding domain-containing protein [Granulosicoccaceae sp. 1_MG-2023]